MSNFFLKYKIQIYNIVMIVLFTSCEVNETAIEIDELGKKARVELFTRTDSYDLPSLRSSANESELNKTPWVIVFKKNASNNFIYEEAVQAFELSGIDKRYVELTKQTDDCKLLILANTQSVFYVKGNSPPYAFSEANFDGLFSGKKIEEVASTLSSQPLNNPQTTIPYSNNSLLPMSYVIDLNGGINNNTHIGTAGSPLQLDRIVAKIVVKNAVPGFKFKGITAVVNTPKESLLHRISGSSPLNNNSQDLVEYRANNTYSTEIIQALSETTLANPIYLYESKSGTTNDTYLIIKGEYNSVDYYYKMVLIDANLAKLDILRNHLYTFTLTNVYGKGFQTVDDAKKSNVNFNFATTVTVTDDYSHEIVANDDYYLALTNSIFIGYTDTNQTYTISSLATNCTTDFADRTISLVNIWSNMFSIYGSTEIPIVTSSTSNPVTKDVQVTINTNLDHPWGSIKLLLGNLEKSIAIKRKPAVSASGETLVIGSPDTNAEPDKYPYKYVSGYVVENPTKDWIKLISSVGEIRNDSSSMTVDDGIINVYVEPNKTNAVRRGTVFLAAYNSSNENGEKWFRIKLDISQKK